MADTFILVDFRRYGRGKVLGSFCGALAEYLQHYRRQILSLLPAGCMLSCAIVSQ